MRRLGHAECISRKLKIHVTLAVPRTFRKPVIGNDQVFSVSVLNRTRMVSCQPDRIKFYYCIGSTKQLYAGSSRCGLIYRVVQDATATVRRAEAKRYIAETVNDGVANNVCANRICLLYTSPSPRDQRGSRMPSSA